MKFDIYANMRRMHLHKSSKHAKFSQNNPIDFAGFIFIFSILDHLRELAAAKKTLTHTQNQANHISKLDSPRS